MNWTRILQDLYLGSCPRSRSDLERIAEQTGVGAIVNVQTDDDLESHSLPEYALVEACEDLGFEFVRIAITDNDYTSVEAHLPEAIEALHDLLEDGWSVYLHCTSGVNRAPTVAIAYLAVHGDMSLEEATAYVMERRPECMPFIGAIEAHLRR